MMLPGKQAMLRETDRQAPFAAPIVRQGQPENIEFPFPSLSSFITPNEQFYIRSHFSTPDIDPATWHLTIDGLGKSEFDFTLDQLKKMPAQTRTITLECAGNGRVFLVPKVGGAQWELGAVSNAEWTGVPLTEVLAAAGVKPATGELIMQGADEGEPDEAPKPPGSIHYAHSIPVSKIDDVLLAYQMNGQSLPRSHGAPLRAVVGGWYGMASVKWLSRITLTDRPFAGYFQTVDYAHWQQRHGMPVRVPITRIRLKAQIARPALREIVPRNSVYRAFGAAWGGDSPIAAVELSIDGGKNYAGATLIGEPIRHAWRFWEYHWQTPATPGRHVLVARAIDADGATQPAQRDRNLGNYIIHHTIPVEVEVK